MFWRYRIKRFSSFQIITLGFLLAILAGSFLLMLPVATAGGGKTSVLDAVFTAASAVCVTGLVVHDTATWWTPFGQGVILCLIQIGGMGVVTVAVAIARISGRKIGLMQRSTMQEAIAAPQMGGIVRLTVFILKVTFAAELAGTVLMAPVFIRGFGVWKGLWYALFHSVSAFCNAGFDLMGIRRPYSSLIAYAFHPVINGVILSLIITGGIGFLTWDDIRIYGWRFRRYRMQSKVILAMTGILILFPACYYFFFEFTGAGWRNLSLTGRMMASIFQAVTPRTAGFNTVDLNDISEAGQVMMVILMLIGGSPGSTAGGMKTTTLAVLWLSALAVFRRQTCAECFGRRIAGETIRYAAAVLLMYIVLLLAGGMTLSLIEDLPVLACFFEAASAVCTVGLTLGITEGLCTASKMILILLMFFGRVGGITFVFAALSGTHGRNSKCPQGKITVG